VKRSNDVTLARTEPCIALYPAVSHNSSWVMYNLVTNTYVKSLPMKKGTGQPDSSL